MSSVKVRNRIRHGDNVSRATLSLTRPGMPVPVTATTNASGLANLATTGLANGAYTLTITPADTSVDPVGPAIAVATTPDRIYRSIQINITLASGNISAATVPATQALNGTVAMGTNPRLTVNLQPVWMKSPNNGARGVDIDGIIIHHTAGSAIGGTLEEFLGSSKSANYVIDTDGQIVKMVQDTRKANHAGVAMWNGNSNLNSRTIGIEIVNATGPYPAAQYAALTGLLTRLTAAFGTIVPWNVVGHSDIAVNDSGRLGRKSGDPGLQFEWSRVEALGLGMIAAALGPLPAIATGVTMYASFFVLFPGLSLRSGDNDTARRFGGARRPTLTGNPVRELQDDLSTIGYAVGTPDGDFGQKLEMAVQMFQEHFFAGGRGHKAPDGRVDLQTATLIKAVVAGKAAAAAPAPATPTTSGAASGAASGGSGGQP